MESFIKMHEAGTVPKGLIFVATFHFLTPCLYSYVGKDGSGMVEAVQVNLLNKVRSHRHLTGKGEEVYPDPKPQGLSPSMCIHLTSINLSVK